MARFPGSEWKPLPEQGTQGVHTKTQLIYHSIVGTAASAYAHFGGKSVTLESTFIVSLGGHTWQLLESYERADANRTANLRAISVETEDNGHPDDFPWTAAQLAELIRLGVWACRNHPIPARLCPVHDAPGIGYHTLFGAPSPWTPVAKTCPGRVRIRQFRDVVLPGIVAGVLAPVPLPPKPAIEEDPMFLAQAVRAGKRTGPVYLVGGATARGVPTDVALAEALRLQTAHPKAQPDGILDVAPEWLAVFGVATP